MVVKKTPADCPGGGKNLPKNLPADRLILQVKYLLAVVALTVRYVQPLVVALVNELVELDVACADHLEQSLIVRSAPGSNIGSFAS